MRTRTRPIALALAAAAILATACRNKSAEPRDVPTAASTRTSAAAVLPNRPRWHYTFRPSADVSTMETELCFADRVPQWLDAQMIAARQSLLTAHRLRPSGDTTALVRRQQGIALSSLEPGDCVRLRTDLAATLRRAASDRRTRREVQRFGDDLLLSPDYWLWRPSGDLDDVALTASFELPDGVAIAVPWPRTSPDGPYHIPTSAFRWKVQGAVGRFQPATVSTAGATLHAAILGDDWTTPRDTLLAWLRDAAGAVGQLYDGFPVPSAQILLQPVPGSKVQFGHAAQGGGASVTLMTGTHSTAESLRDDWLAVHEMLHLGMPLFDAESAWFSEGLATLYEPIVRARAGLITADDAWEQLHDGFQRGASQGSGRPLRKESADMHETHQYWRVYWAGAAIALIADVRARQQGAPTVDQQLRAIRDCCLTFDRQWDAQALLDRVASPGNAPDLASVAAPFLDSSAFPDLVATYRALGLAFDERGRVSYTGGEAETRLRDAIMTHRVVAGESRDPTSE